MDAEKIIRGKKILIVDDEPDVLATLIDLLNVCKIDTAVSFETAKKLMENDEYQAVVLDIMGVNGYELLDIANSRGIPAIMLTAHALTPEDLKRSADQGAVYYAPKEKMIDIKEILVDVFEAIENKKSPWGKMFDRLIGFYDNKFGGPDWRKQEEAFWKEKVKQRFPFETYVKKNE